MSLIPFFIKRTKQGYAIDTNIYISAIFCGGKPREVVDLGRDGKIPIFTSTDIEREIVEKLKTKFKLNEEEVDQIISDFDITLQREELKEEKKNREILYKFHRYW